MGGVSNKTIVALLAVALVVTVLGTVVSIVKLGDIGEKYTLLTGAAVETGTSSVTVQGTSGLTIPDGAITLPTGYYDPTCTTGYGVIDSASGFTSCWLNTTGGTPIFLGDYHQLENSGTAVVSLTAYTDQTDAISYLCGTGGCPSTGGTAAKVEVKITDDVEPVSCASAPLTTYATLLNWTSNTTQTLCSYFDYEDTNDVLNVYYNYTIPSDVDQGQKLMTVTYTATAQ
jgi:hypothetical protein